LATLTNWFLSQIEFLPAHILGESSRLASGRLLEQIIGARELSEVRALLDRPPSGAPRVPTVLLPGIMGSLLASVRGIISPLWLSPGVIANGHINLLDLNEEGTGDRSPDVEIVPIGIEKVTYLKLILALARETRLYEFPYDWRRHLEWNAGVLHKAIERWSIAQPSRRFVLVGHSMGGMLARTYLARYPREAEQRIERVIMLGTPLYGVALALLIFPGQTTESKIVSNLHPDNDVRRFVTNLPSAYQLLPPPPELFALGHPYPANWDVYDASAWGIPHLRQDYLDDARRYHRLLSESDPQVEVIEIVGCNRSTVTGVLRSQDAEDVDNLPTFTPVEQNSQEELGDGTVPLWSTRMEGITTYYLDEGHHFLPSNGDAIQAILALIHGQTPLLPRELPQPTGVLRRLSQVPVLQQVRDLRQRIESGNLTREDLGKLFFAR